MSQITTKTHIMQELRIKLYNEIEALELQLRNENNVNQYGFSSSPIRTQIQDLETKISETWTN